jgi:hypothetical protein
LSGFLVSILSATGSAASTSLTLDETDVQMTAYRYVASVQRRSVCGTAEANGRDRFEASPPVDLLGPDLAPDVQHPVVDLQLPWSMCNAWCPHWPPTGRPSRVPRPQPPTPSLRTAPVCSNVQTPASGVPPRSLSLWTASRRHLQCDLSEAERSGSSASSSHEDSTMFLHARLDRGEKIPARRCAGDDPALAMIGRVCRGWPRCQQIHATCAMLHGRREGETRDERGERRSQVLFVPGGPYILTSKPAAGELSSGLCV